MNFAVKMTGISQTFGPVVALDSVDLSVESGIIHAVVGENGAGKSTLMKVLYGQYQANSGEVELFGQPVIFKTPAQALKAGVGMVSQHYGIIPGLSCLENLMLGAEGSALINVGKAKIRAQELANRMSFDFVWEQDAEDLTPAKAQKLEILKLLWRNSKVLILDEPTAMLSPADADALFQSLKSLVATGSTVILVTHRLPEVLEYCKTVTVLRGGKLIITKPVAETNANELAELIIGEAMMLRSKTPPIWQGEGLRLQGVFVKGYRGDDAVKDANFSVDKGEVVGIAGVDGNGQRELIHAIAGVINLKSGSIQWAGNEQGTRKPTDRLNQGFRLIPEDRLEEGVIEEWSLLQNSRLGLQRVNALNARIAEPESWTLRLADRFRTKRGSLKQSLGSLSGGNQQRFVAARALESDPALLLAFQPARGLDLKGSADIYAAIREQAGRGLAALVVSFDLDELLQNCDRVLVMNHGNIFAPPDGQELDREVIGKLMVGGE